MKRILSLIIVTALVCALCLTAAACKSTTDKDGDDSGAITENIPGGVADVSAEVLEALSNSGDVTIYTFYENEEGLNASDYQNDFNSYFSEVYGGNLICRNIVWEGWENTYITDFAAEEAPDVTSLWQKLWPKVANRGMVYSLKELEENGVVGIDHPLFDNERELLENNFSYKKENYGIGVSYNSAIYCGVNLDLFKQFEVKSPVDYYKEGTWTMDNLIKCCVELTRDSDGDEVIDVLGYNGWDLHWFVVANGGQLVEMDDDGKLYTCFDSPNVLNAFEDLRELYNTTKAATDNDSWQNGRIGIYAALKQNIGRKIVGDEVTFDWDVVPFPKGKDNDGTIMPGDIEAYGISTSSKNSQGALNYIIANRVFGTVNGEKYPDPNYSKFNEEQIAMFADYDLQAKYPLFMGVGTLWSEQWGFWWEVKAGGGSVSEILAQFEPMFEAQCQVEMESATA